MHTGTYKATIYLSKSLHVHNSTHTGLDSHSNTQIIHILKHLKPKSLNCLVVHSILNSQFNILYSNEVIIKKNSGNRIYTVYN